MALVLCEDSGGELCQLLESLLVGGVFCWLAQHRGPESLNTIRVICEFIFIQERKVGCCDLVGSQQRLVRSLLLEQGEAELRVGLRIAIHPADSERPERCKASVTPRRMLVKVSRVQKGFD